MYTGSALYQMIILNN